MHKYKDDTVTIFRSLLYETNSVVVHTKDAVIVVDPCWLPHEVEEIRRYVYTILQGRSLYLLLTHSDYDHIIGYKAFPDAQVIASHRLAARSEQDKLEIVEQIKAFDDEYYLVRPYEICYPEVDWQVEAEGDTLVIGETVLNFYHALGHNDDGLFTVVEPYGLLICGDYFSDIEFPYIYFSSDEYEKTVLKLETILQRHDIKMLLTGHGNETAHIVEMKKRQLDALRYIQKMRVAISVGNKTDIDDLIKDVPFPRNMRKFHRDNQLLFEKELGIN